ncbi:hypothetical protein RJZ56_003226 [Blastomyces dermatitidis]|uniref:Aminodeoxychorismate lyase n=2 Tax=Ajellomyces dermatitidis TaxID=5039 RepID=F2TAV8_AJEDA|nr:uncharacterized protein BDCG_06606 [Blastomyces dermatitidis ER-3]EEQ91486.1 hypothetical protein BDCG_06606 [Blastomyces dermatitidis ER-3]EGE80371.1 aminodeoxychorismate lyase [Blastomyces dermatitidis ATCC 18188]EQL32489.1 hypothetical protein BDFG_05358 [Blastomyces dermatitidis ATCC 26199]
MQPSQPAPNFQIISTLRYDPDLPRTPDISNSYPSPRTSPYYLLSYHYDRLLAASLDFKWPAAIALLQQQPRETVLSQLTQKFNEHIKSDPTHPWRLRVLLDAAGALTVEAVPITSNAPPPPLSTPSNILLVLPSATADLSRLLSCNVIHAEATPAARVAIEPWTVRLDTQPTHPSLFTRHKTTARDHYTASRARAGITASPLDRTEVLIYNPAGEVMEGSITTVYFRRRRKQGLGPAASIPVPGEARDIGDGDSRGPADDSSYYWVTPPLSSGGNAGTSRRYALAAGMCVEEVVRVEELRELEGQLGRVWLSNGVRGFMPAVLRLNNS